MMKKRKRILVYILLLSILAQVLSGCGLGNKSGESPQNNETVAEEFVQEEFVTQTVLTEDQISEDFIRENLVVEDNVYEIQVEEQLICQTYTFEIVAGVTSEEEMQSLLPGDIDEYDIDWPS